ncbi:Glutathione reductase [Cronobacter turicensis 564]|nr:Glutathione reductase [Cronobacter turicensis 564]
MTRHYDYLAIGGGSGGIASVNRAAMYGQKCALIEAKALGGTCVNVGCVPKKIMWHAAQIAEAIHLYGPDYGFDTTVNHFDWQKLVASRTAYIDRIHTSYDNVLGKNNVDVIQGYARFVDAHTVEVNGERITADHILIATGGRPSHPDIPGAEYGIDSDGFFALSAMPPAWRSSARAISPLNWRALSTRWAQRRTCLCVSTRRCARSIRCFPKRWWK